MERQIMAMRIKGKQQKDKRKRVMAKRARTIQETTSTIMQTIVNSNLKILLDASNQKSRTYQDNYEGPAGSR